MGGAITATTWELLSTGSIRLQQSYMMGIMKCNDEAALYMSLIFDNSVVATAEMMKKVDSYVFVISYHVQPPATIDY